MIDPLSASIRTAVSGLEAQSLRIRTVAENLANAQSTGSTPGAAPYVRKLVTFENAFDEAAGANLVKVSSIEPSNDPYRVEHDPDHPAADERGYVRLPNVNVLIEMADIREATRSYEANLQVVKQSAELKSMTTDLLRSSS